MVERVRGIGSAARSWRATALCVASGLLLVMLFSPGIAAWQDQSVRYAATPYPLVAISCHEGGHAYTPQGDPDAYATPEGWVFSGEPECIPGDAMAADERSGISGFYLEFDASDVGKLARITLVDDLFDGPFVWIRDADGVLHEACRGVTFEIVPPPCPWFCEPPYRQWAFVHTAGVQPDTNDVCLGSMGTGHVTLV